MLKYINYQLHSDPTTQEQLERDAAIQIKKRLKANLAAFSQHIPSIIPQIQAHKVQQYSLFCTKKSEMNIVNFVTGRVWYGDNSTTEVAEEVISFCQKAPYIDLSASHPSEHQEWSTEPIPTSIDVLIMFGLGLGYQLNDLLSKVKIKYLIVYEPNLDAFFCSLQANDWQKTFDLLTSSGVQIFLQIGNAGDSVSEDLNELSAVTKFDRVYVYRHYFHSKMDKVVEYLFSKHLNLGEQNAEIASFLPYDDFNDSVSERAGNVLGNKKIELKRDSSQIYDRNLSAFKKYYPNIFCQIEKYKVNSWVCILDDSGKDNILHITRRAFFYQDSQQDSEELVSYFSLNPSKDNVALRQSSTGKFDHYIHFSYAEKVEQLIEKNIQGPLELPAEVSSLVVFGICLGRHIEVLLNNYTIQNLYIFEPNLDYFYASLHVFDWENLFSAAAQRGQRVYLNLGGDGSDYFKDVIAQFYLAGPYSIADTYILTSYYNNRMSKAIAELREELKVVLAFGEYFDHVRYGIAHTYHSLTHNHMFLKENKASYKDLEILNMPVFIVGNGPSLDVSFDYIRSYRERVIIISCGTALYSLYKNGIAPDFHAELEQNRATYCWINRVEDKSFLRNIRLLSVNGIHPETASLFKDVMLCFKSGEASANLFNNGLRRLGFNISEISYAYPTVSNLALNFALHVGFKTIYLFGVDLGYADVKYHHSKASAYYKKDGSEIFSYEQAHGSGDRVKGNFRPFVYTKREFNLSRKLIEEAIKSNKGSSEIYNCSDGVKIDGAMPLKLDNILIKNLDFDKEYRISEFCDKAYYSDLKANSECVFANLSMEKLSISVKEWLAILKQEVIDQNGAREIIREQWELLHKKRASLDDPTPFLFHGSFYYFGGIMTKIAANISNDNPQALACFNDIKKIWKEYIQIASREFSENPMKFDDVDVSHLFS